MEYMPEIIQVRPTDNFKVFVYFDDGSIKLYDASELIHEGIFTKLQHTHSSLLMSPYFQNYFTVSLDYQRKMTINFQWLRKL